MTKKPDDKSSAILSFPQTQTERTKMRNRAECGDRIRAYRKARELSQPQLAAMLGITKNSITNWETGVSRPELSMIPKLCQALDITTDVFFDMPAGRQTLSKAEQEHMRLYHSLDAYRQRLSGDLPVMHRMWELWAYLSAGFTQPEPYLKRMRKAKNLSEYRSAVDALFREQRYTT